MTSQFVSNLKVGNFLWALSNRNFVLIFPRPPLALLLDLSLGINSFPL